MRQISQIATIAKGESAINRTALKNRIEPCLSGLFGYAFSLAGERSRAEDLVQDCAVRILSARSVPADDPAFRAWAFRILRNLFIDRWRANQRETSALGTFEAIEGAPPLRFDENLINALTVRIGIARLPHDLREIVTLIDVTGFSYAEAAEIVSIPKGTVMSRLSRARSVLMTELGASNVRGFVQKKNASR